MTGKWIFLRGLTRGNGHWGDFPIKFKEKFPHLDVQFLEIPGNGTLHNLKTPVDPLKVIQILKEKIHNSGAQQPLNLCGISLGGMIALKWAEQYPDEIESVATINTSLKGTAPFYKRLNPKTYGTIIKALLSNNPLAREKWILQITSENNQRSQQFLNEFAEFTERNPTSWFNFFRQLLLANNIKINNPIAKRVKILVSENDRLVAPFCSQKIAQKFHFDLYKNSWAGHDIPLDDPEWLIETLMGLDS